MALGEILKKARLDMGISTSELAARTRMKKGMVEDLEREDFSKVAATIYGKGFIRLYAEQVGLDPNPLIDEYLSRFVAPDKGGKKSARAPEPEVEEDDEYEDEDDILTKVLSFFKGSDAEEAEAEEDEPKAEKRDIFKPLRTADPTSDSKPERVPKKKESVASSPVEVVDIGERDRSAASILEEPVSVPELEPVVTLEEIEPVAEEPEPVAEEIQSAPELEPVATPDVVSTEEPDLFSFSEKPQQPPQPEPLNIIEPEEPQAEPVEEKKEEISYAAAADAEALEDEEEPPQQDDEDQGPSFAEIATERFEVIKEFSIEVTKRLDQIIAEAILDLRILLKKLKTKLPNINDLELSLNSVPVMITIAIIVLLLVSGLANLIRKSKSDTVNIPEDIPVVEQVQDNLRTVVSPPEPYYK